MELTSEKQRGSKRTLYYIIANAVIVPITLVFFVIALVILISTSLNSNVPSFGKTAAITATSAGSTNFTFNASGFRNEEKIALDVDKSIIVGDVIAYTVFYANNSYFDVSNENRVFIGKVTAIERNSIERTINYYLQTDEGSGVSVFVEDKSVLGACISASSLTAQNILNVNSPAYIGLSISIPFLILLITNILIFLLTKEKNSKKVKYAARMKGYPSSFYSARRNDYASASYPVRNAAVNSAQPEAVKHENKYKPKKNDEELYEEIELDTVGEVYDRTQKKNEFASANNSYHNFDERNVTDTDNQKNLVPYGYGNKQVTLTKPDNSSKKKNSVKLLESPEGKNKQKTVVPMNARLSNEKINRELYEKVKRNKERANEILYGKDLEQEEKIIREVREDLGRNRYSDTVRRNQESAKEILYGKDYEEEERIIREVRETVAKNQQDELSAYLEKAKLNEQNALTEKEYRNLSVYGAKYLNNKKGKNKKDEKYKKFVSALIDKEKKLKEQTGKQERPTVNRSNLTNAGPIVKNAVSFDNTHIEKRIPTSGSSGIVGAKSNLVFNPTVSDKIKNSPSKTEIAYKRAQKREAKKKAAAIENGTYKPTVNANTTSKASNMLYTKSYIDRANAVNSNYDIKHTNIVSKSDSSANFSSRIDKIVKEERNNKENKKIADTNNKNEKTSASSVLKTSGPFIPGNSKKKSEKKNS